jgi:hypothetical protein
VGVGDSGRVDAALACDTDVVARGPQRRRASLEERYDATQRVRVWGFTERMTTCCAPLTWPCIPRAA